MSLDSKTRGSNLKTCRHWGQTDYTCGTDPDLGIPWALGCGQGLDTPTPGQATHLLQAAGAKIGADISI